MRWRLVGGPGGCSREAQLGEWQEHFLCVFWCRELRCIELYNGM